MRTSENVATLIRSGSSGYFTLYDEFKNNNFGSFPTTIDEDSTSKKAAPVDLALRLMEMLEHLGSGKYKIELRNNSKDNTKSPVCYVFQHGNITENNQAVKGSGIGFTELNNQVETQVTKALERERELFEREKKLWEFEKRLEILELKTSHQNEIGSIKAKTKEDKESNFDKLLPLIIAGGVAGLVKIVPESKDLISKTLDTINNEEDGNEINNSEIKQVVRED